MYEITFRDPAAISAAEGYGYDFTFENRYDIFHRPSKGFTEYTARDRQSGLRYVITHTDTPVGASRYPKLIPHILRSLKHTGDRRHMGATAYPPTDLIDIIFRVIMPQYGYTLREQQLQMAQSLYAGLMSKKVTLCEAEVGTGKTMAYLVAGLVAKLFDKNYSFMGYPVTITTSSIELQRSIMEKEIPALSKMLQEFGLIPKPLAAVLRKGKEHYFCPRRYMEYKRSLLCYPKLFSNTLTELQTVEQQGNLLDLDPLQLTPFIKSRICVKGSCCDCPKSGRCPYAEFIRSATKPYAYDFQITNHNLFLNSRKVRRNRLSRSGLLPCNFCIIDEAHKLSGTAVDVFGAKIAFDEVGKFLNAVKYIGGKAVTDRIAYKFLLSNAEHLNKKLLSMLGNYKLYSGEDVSEVKVSMTSPMYNTIRKLVYQLKEIESWPERKYVGGSATTGLSDRLSAFLAQQNIMYWISYDKSTNTKSFCCTTTCPKKNMQECLWLEPNIHYALTSGTMRDDSGFSFFKEDLGISECLETHSVSEFVCDSPFDYKHNTRLYISQKVPVPDMKNPDYIPAVAQEILSLIRATHGHTAVLFTSYKMLNAVFRLVKDDLKEYPLITMSRSNKNAITQFKETGNGVLFASGSMWEGVDCAGDILSSVIIVRLPFPLRTQAMERKKRACVTTQEFIRRFAVPQMIIKVRQGAGRLIRAETDTGILAILDARAAKGGAYHQRVRKTLEKYPLVSSIEEVAAFIDSVKGPSYKKEVADG